MMDGLKGWWRTRTVREQRLLLAGGGLAAVVLAWLLIVRPLDSALAEQKARHDRAVIALAQVEARAEAIDAVRASGGNRPSGRIADLVTAEAVRTGFTVTDTDPVGTNGVRVAIAAVRPQTFFAWVADLETRLGLTVAQLTARPNSDETLSVEVVFTGGA